MKTIFYPLLIVVHLLGTALLGQGQDPNATRALSLSDALGLALAGEESLAGPQARLAAASARLGAIGSLPSPELRIGYDDGRFSGEYSTEFALRLRLANPWEIQAAREVGRAEEDTARHHLDYARALLAAEVKALYFDILHLRRNATIAAELADAHEALRSTHDSLLAAGSITLPKAIESRLAANLLAADAADASRNHQAALDVLRVRLNLFDAVPLLLTEPLPETDVNATLPTLNELFDRAVVDRPELLALAGEGDAARARVRQARARSKLWFSFIQAGFEHDERRTYAEDNWGVLLGVDLPLPGLPSEVEAASADLQETLARERLARRELRIALARALGDLRAAEASLTDRRSALAAVEEELAPVLGERLPGQAIDPSTRHRLRISLLRARRDSYAAERRRHVASIAIEALLGQPL